LKRRNWFENKIVSDIDYDVFNFIVSCVGKTIRIRSFVF